MITHPSWVIANADQFADTVESYKRVRPITPTAVVDLLCQFSGMERPPDCLVDIGCGPGLSLQSWIGHAKELIGIDPCEAMLQEAGRSFPSGHISWRLGHGGATGLQDNQADIVTAVQSFHWMEPTSTLNEVARILKPNGVFAMINYDMPPLMHWELDALFNTFIENTIRVEKKYFDPNGFRRWSKNDFGVRALDSGHFRCVRDISLHAVEMGDSTRLVDLALSGVPVRHSSEPSLDSLGLEALRRRAVELWGEAAIPWWFHFRLTIAIR